MNQRLIVTKPPSPATTMEMFLHILAAILLVLTLAIGWILTLVAMPGIWLMVLAAAGYAWLGPQTGLPQLQWSTVIVLTVLAGVGEIAEFAAGMVGAHRAGGSRRAAIFSLIGSLIGAISGATVGIPIPILGSAIAAVVGGALGAFGGAAFAEHTRGELAGHSLKVGQAAFWGRILGTGAKTFVASIIAAVAIIALVT
ncbi:DUF456 domain-containing protein [Bythopirellula polymerisocia]|uniref:DUF456 domain-containing protein n=1 Tax=Bythopirellula polymerisocia TaxID=2528003 RepID=A0A5C6CYA4_9BACT|nr:DUF456 domain-containing protein [Bythopirellula polymerisocia]TWU28527.1 hypothetical protein Pla144_18170 [Bythopirellula polymerisocia]